MSNLKNGRFLTIEEGSRFFVVCFLHTSAKMFFYQTPGQPTPHITDRGVSAVTLGWVGNLNQRITPRFHGGVCFSFCQKKLFATTAFICNRNTSHTRLLRLLLLEQFVQYEAQAARLLKYAVLRSVLRSGSGAYLEDSVQCMLTYPIMAR